MGKRPSQGPHSRHNAKRTRGQPDWNDDPNSLQVSSYNQTDIPTPTLTKPNPIYGFSLGPTRDFLPTRQALRFYAKPEAKSLDIELGCGRAIWKEEKAEYLEHMLQGLNAASSLPWDMETPPNIVTWRGIVRKIMCLPYEKENFRYSLNPDPKP